tara:strand:- start:22457 stop:23191 length:735 start_codon:yes stop_codon:yes gene_type:complete
LANFRIDVEYDGTDFFGWQLQPERRTVQGELEEALTRINGGELVRVHGAGRTDAGVHAKGQVANFTLPKEWEATKLRRAINGNSREDVTVRECTIQQDDFHSRFSAVKRFYRYSCFLGTSPMVRRFAWELNDHISLDALNACASLLTGDIDFTSFCKHVPRQENRRCLVNLSQWINSGSFVIFEIEANRFLQHLVRCLVGTMIEVALGRMTVDRFGEILDEKNSAAKVVRAPARGLCLEKVSYT